MQNAKDSFYMALRTRLTAINPERTILLRGAVRPGILVEEAEAPFSQLPSDVFVLRWRAWARTWIWLPPWQRSNARSRTRPAERRAFGGLDRGRALSEMDEELIAMLQPFYTPKLNYTATPAGGDADAGVLGRAGIWSGREQSRPAEPQRECDGLQLPGAGGVNGSNMVFRSGAGGAAGASILCAGEPGGADAGALRSIATGRVQSRRSAGAVDRAWVGFRISRASRRARSTPLLTGIPAAALEQVRETRAGAGEPAVSELDQADHGAGHGLAAHECARPASGRSIAGRGWSAGDRRR